MKKRLVSVFCIFALISAFCFSQSSSSSEENDLTPVWVKDLRRCEIISLGSLPFVTIGVTLGYGAVLYNKGLVSSFPNPLDKTSAQFTSNQALEIFGISLGISAGIGVTDFVINIIKRNIEEDKARKLSEGNSPEVITVTPEQIEEMLKNSDASETLETESDQ